LGEYSTRSAIRRIETGDAFTGEQIASGLEDAASQFRPVLFLTLAGAH
jgi:hypothetical protein